MSSLPPHLVAIMNSCDHMAECAPQLKDALEQMISTGLFSKEDMSPENAVLLERNGLALAPK